MIIAKLYEVPDNCDFCPQLQEPFSQGGICFRCPVFNCSGEDPLLHPIDYREDWAKEFAQWFKGDRKDWPQLPLWRA